MERGPIVFPYRLPVNWYYVADKVVLLHHAPSKRATVTPEFSERAVRFTLETSSEDLGGDEKSANAVVRGMRSMGEVPVALPKKFAPASPYPRRRWGIGDIVAHLYTSVGIPPSGRSFNATSPRKNALGAEDEA